LGSWVSNLQRGAGSRERGEPDDVAEVDGHRVETLRLHRNALLQVFGDSPTFVGLRLH
jgi:hypothetical protein